MSFPVLTFAAVCGKMSLSKSILCCVKSFRINFAQHFFFAVGVPLLCFEKSAAAFVSLFLERVHIKRASKIIANMMTERKMESSLS